MAAEPKPPTRPIWAEAGDVSAPADPKKILGWVTEIPPFEYFNWVLNNLASFAAHVNESGIPGWDGITQYDIDAYCKGSDGILYRSSINLNINNDPSTINGKQFWANALTGKFSSQSFVTDSGFSPVDLNDMNLLLANSAGPFYLQQGIFTSAQLTTIRDNILTLWTIEVETP